MGGSVDQSQQTQNTNQNQNSSGTASVAPWEPTQGLLSNLISQISSQMGGNAPTGTESTAINDLQSAAAGQIGRTANSVAYLQSGGAVKPQNATDVYTMQANALTPTIRGDYLDPSTNPFFNNTVNTIGRDTEERLRALYAGSGRNAPGAGNYGYNAGKGIAEATAPIFSNVYEQERGRQMQAANDLYGAGNSTLNLLSSLDQNRANNIRSGIDIQNNPYGTILGAEATRRNIPLSTLASLVGLTTPIASLGRTGTQSSVSNTTGTGTATKNPSLLDDLTSISNLFRH